MSPRRDTAAFSSATAVAHRPGRNILTTLVLVVALFVSLVARGASAQAYTTTTSRMTLTEATMAKAVLLLMNYERAVHHLPALTTRARLDASARTHDLAMARANVMSHQLPGEPSFDRRITDTGYRWHYVGENIAWNSQMTVGGLKALQSLMYNEKAPYDGHRLNILSREYQNVGIDVYIDKKHHKIWMTEDFGRH